MRVARPVSAWSGLTRPIIPLRYSLRPHHLQPPFHRAQHDNYGPHKEYFQVPGQEPKPDLTPYVRESQQSSSSRQNRRVQPSSLAQPYTQTADEALQQDQPRGWVRLPRFIRSTIWLLLFLQLGVATGTAVITWEYLSPPFEPGSPEEQELVEEITEALDTHPMVEDLREQNWTEVDAFTPDLSQGLKGRHLVHQALGGNNSQGVFLRVFHHPSQEYTMLVFFFGYGVEGWPDTIHGGMIATLLEEGISKHVAYYYPGHFTTSEKVCKIDYKKPCKPGEVYGVPVAPSGREASQSGNVHLTRLSVTSLMVQLAGAPQVSTQFNIATNTETHTIGIPTQRGQQPTHAICQAEVGIVPKEVTQNGKAFEVGGTQDPGFGRALDFLKKRPEFQESQPPPSPLKEEEKDDD